MKTKLVLFIGIFLISPVLFGQTLITQNFSSGVVPPVGWTIDAHGANWHNSNSVHSGGTAPEIVLKYSPTFTGYSRLISPIINTTGQTSLTLAFKQYMDHYTTPYTIGIATRSGGGSWSVVLQANPTASFQQTTAFVITNSDVGAADFQFCFFFSGYSYNINNWYLDDISLSVTTTRDGAISGLNVPKYSLGHIKVKGALQNLGTSAMTSADVNYRVDQGTVHTTSVTGLNLALGQVSDFAIADSIILIPGDYFLKVWISNVSGTGPDLNSDNDTVSMTLHVASSSVARKPFYEEFTSSTCGPCATFNSGVFNPFITAHGDEISLIKYQMNWPVPGDPYYTDEGGVRRDFYGVSYVPDLYVDGQQTNTNSSGVNTGLTNSLATPSFMDLISRYSFPVSGTDTSVTVNVDIIPHVNGNLTLFAAVIEEVTYHNKLSNGETAFHHVMMKMIPNAHGTPVNLVDGQTMSLELAADLSGTNIERWTDLMVLVWVQDSVTQEFLQSGYADSINVGIRPVAKNTVFRVYPNPAKDFINISGVIEIREVSIMDNQGRTALHYEDGDMKRISLGTLPDGIYLVVVRSKDDVFTTKMNLVR
jgi:hypothetical protein